jgi:hypothetical protein
MTRGRLSAALGVAATVLAAAVSYTALGLPVPASAERVAAVEQYARDTREIVLLDKLFMRQEELDRAAKRLRTDPGDEELQRRVYDLQRQIQLLERQLEDLDTSRPNR